MTTVISECHVYNPEVNNDYLLYLMKSSRGKYFLKRNANLEIENISEILFIVTKNKIPAESQFLDTPTIFTESPPFISQVAVRMKDTGEYVLLKVYKDSLEEQLNKLLERFAPTLGKHLVQYGNVLGIWKANSREQTGMVFIDTEYGTIEFTPEDDFAKHTEIDIEAVFMGEEDCVITQRGGGKKKSKQRKRKSKSKKHKHRSISKKRKRRNKSKRR